MTGKTWMIVVIILFIGYKIYRVAHEMITSQKAREQWTSGDRDELIKKCIEETGDTGAKYQELTRAYCECSHDSIMKRFTKSEYLALMKRPREEQIKISLPIFETCLAEYKIAVSKAEKESK